MKMLRLTLCIVALYCGEVVAQDPVPTLNITKCNRNEAEYTVTDGRLGGITFVEGTPSASVTCNTTLVGDPVQVFVMHFGQCAVQTGSVTNTTGMTISFVVIVQARDLIYTKTDKRWKVTCTLSETTTTINTELIGTAETLPYGIETYETRPEPDLYFLYYDMLKARVNQAFVPVGEPLSLVIELKEKIPNYFIIAKECTVYAETMDRQLVGGENNKIVIIQDGCPTIPEIFDQFQYGTETGTDSSGATFDSPRLEAIFNVFTPYPAAVEFSKENMTIIFSCRVRVCVDTVADCIEPTCPPPAPVRRRRQAEENNTKTIYDLHDQFRVSLFNDMQVGEEPTTVHLGEDNLCMDRLAFWGALLTLLALLVAAWIALCCFFLCVRHRRRRECRTLIYEDIQNKTSSKDSTITPVEVNVVEKPMKTVPFVLPRYHAADFAVETVEHSRSPVG